ncbi:MAG: VWA domain-containing protein, partial [Gammaproteobacteria bacterium]|nr:VWA domain-containing protein [Gammaproteobacteria bacterium]
DDSVEVGIRNIKVALKRLRHFARSGNELELDVDGTIRATADNGGYLDLRLVPERRNRAKVLLLFDVGGSMDYHVRICEELFSAARTEFKHMEQYYFHNFLYDSVWQNNARRYAERRPLWDVIHTYGSDYKLILVGDATMSPYEITHQGGSVEFWNDEAGAIWLRRLLDQFPKAIWLNPEPKKYWQETESIRLTRELMEGRMYSLTLDGLEQGMRDLSR